MNKRVVRSLNLIGSLTTYVQDPILALRAQHRAELIVTLLPERMNFDEQAANIHATSCDPRGIDAKGTLRKDSGSSCESSPYMVVSLLWTQLNNACPSL